MIQQIERERERGGPFAPFPPLLLIFLTRFLKGARRREPSFLPFFLRVRCSFPLRTNLRVRKCGGEDDFAVSRFRLRLRRRLVFSRSLFLFFLSTEKNALSDLILIHSFSSDSTFLTNYNCWLKIYCNIIGGSRGWGIEETKGPPKYAFQSIECVFPPPNGNVVVARGRCPRPPSPSLSGSPSLFRPH